MALPPKNWEENRKEFFSGVDRRLSEPKRSGKQDGVRAELCRDVRDLYQGSERKSDGDC